MLNRIILLLSFALFGMGCSKNKVVFNETHQGDFFLSSGSIYFQKTYKQMISFTNMDKEIIRTNMPNGGLQVKFNDGDEIKGVIVNHQINWQKGGDRKMKVPDVLKRPLNANFQIKKEGTGYKVTVQDIWFSTDQSGRSQKNTELQAFFIQKNGLSFNRDKNTIRLIQYLSNQFTSVFTLKEYYLGNRF